MPRGLAFVYPFDMVRKVSRIVPLAFASLIVGCGGGGSSSSGSYTALAGDASTGARASATSPNGSLVVGLLDTKAGIEWSGANDATPLAPPQNSVVAAVNAVTNDGTVFGSVSSDNGVTTTPASYKTGTGWTLLPLPSGVTSATIKGVSEDGSVVLAGSPAGLYYVKNETATLIPGSADDSNAVLSYDGTTVFEITGAGIYQRKLTDAKPTNPVLGNDTPRTIRSASGAGGAVVGTFTVQGGSTRGYRFIVSGDQFTDVTKLDGDVSSEAVAIDRSGTTVVGDSIAADNTRRPFAWTGSRGIKKLSDDVSGAFDGLTNLHTTGFSADSNTVVGYGTDANGIVRSWKVRR